MIRAIRDKPSCWLLAVSVAGLAGVRHSLERDPMAIPWRFAAIVLLLGSVTSAAAQTVDDLVDSLREQARADLDPAALGTGYAALIDFAVSPEISAATFRPESSPGVSDETISVFRVPIRYVFSRDGSRLRPFIQATLAYETTEAAFDLLPEERILAEWRTYGASGAVGVEYAVSERLRLLGAINAGFGRIDSTAGYTGPIGQTLVGPALDNLVFGWNADARVLGASLGVDYLQPFERFDLEIRGSLIHHAVETYDVSTPFVEFDSRATTADLDINAVVPLGRKLWGAPLSVVVLGGGTAFLGPDRDALGFSSFLEAGVAMDMDLRDRASAIKFLRFGAKVIAGSEVDGFGLIVAYGF